MKSKKLAIISVISTAALLASVGAASAATNYGNGQAAQKSGAVFTHMKNKAGGTGLESSMSSVISVVAQDLNISVETLKTDLRSGKSINDIATAQGVDTSKLASDVQAALKANIDQAVQAGKITSDQATKMESNLAQKAQKILSRNKQSQSDKSNKRAGLGSSMSSIMNVVAQDLNISADNLKTDLSSGKSINDIAAAQGVDTNKLASDVQAALKTNINQAVQAGKITSDQATKMEANVAQRVQKILCQSWHSHTRNNGSSQNAYVSNL